MQLPSIRTLKHYVGANREEAGECTERLEDERRQYLSMVEEKRCKLEEKRKESETSGTGTLMCLGVRILQREKWEQLPTTE